MKRLFLIMAILLSLFLSSNAFAGWTITANYYGQDVRWKSDHFVYCIKIAAESDGSDPAEISLNYYLEAAGTSISKIVGSMLWQVITDPGTAPDAVWAVSFDNGFGASILDLSGLSVSATEINDGATDLDFNPIILKDVQVDFGDIGSDGDSVDVYLIFVK